MELWSDEMRGFKTPILQYLNNRSSITLSTIASCHPKPWRRVEVSGQLATRSLGEGRWSEVRKPRFWGFGAWDLKNHAGIPIAGGIYLIHVKANGIGEKVIKWFGALRPVDLNAF